MRRRRRRRWFDRGTPPLQFGFLGRHPLKRAGGARRPVARRAADDADLDLAIFVGDILGGPCDNSGRTAAVDLFNSVQPR